MHWALSTLGVGPDADERAIKRAYAAKLKTTRPEEDPQGFQALNEAYRTALAWCSARDAGAFDDAAARDAEEEHPARPMAVEADNSTDETSTPTPDTTPDAVSPPAIETTREAPVASSDDAAESEGEGEGEAFDVERFFGDCFAAARDGDPRVIDRWLNAQPVLWSLQHKATIGHWLLRAMHERTPPMPDRSFDRIAQFFGYHELHGGYDPLALQGLRTRVNDAWRWTRQASPQPAAAKNAGVDWTPNQLQELQRQRREIALLQRLGQDHRFIFEPSSRLRMLRRALNPMRVAAIGALLRHYSGENIEELPTRVDRAQARFWLDASDTLRWTRWRLLTVAIRCILFAPVLALIFRLDAEKSGDMGATGAPGNVELLVSSLASVAGLWAVYAGWRTFLHWQRQPDPGSTGLRWLHRLALPAFLLLSLAAAMQDRTTLLPYLLAAIVAHAAFSRYRGRNGSIFAASSKTHRFLASLNGQSMLILAAMFLPIIGMFIEPLTTLESRFPWLLFTLWILSLTLWIRDLARHRKR